ncbi:hypothetical protein M8C21_008877, partial [Ambrosia artemisiifolia]
LPSLKKLFIEGLDEVKIVGQELLGTSIGFTSLEILGFVHMLRWEKWSMNIGVVFPCLKELLIVNCPKLSEVSLEALPSLKVLRMIKCDSGVLKRLVHIASSVTKLEIESILGLNDMVWKGVIKYLGSIEILIIRRCNEMRYLWESAAVASKVLVNLRTLHVMYCGKLVSLGEEEEDNSRSNLLTSLRILYVRDCHNMVQCSSPDSVEYLSVWSCTSITTISLPTGGQKLKSNLWISGWPNLKSIIELNYLVHLTNLRIESCECLESFPDNELPSLTSLKHIGITNCPSMDASFPRGFWPPKLLSLKIGRLKKPISEWESQNFPTSLFHLTLYGEDVSTCSQFSHLLPSSLTSLKIDEFEELESVSMGLQHLTSLEHLHFFNCPNLMDLPDMLLPSLLSFRIRNCPNLNDRCSTRGCYWPLISDIPCIDTPFGPLSEAKVQVSLSLCLPSNRPVQTSILLKLTTQTQTELNQQVIIIYLDTLTSAKSANHSGKSCLERMLQGNVTCLTTTSGLPFMLSISVYRLWGWSWHLGLSVEEISSRTTALDDVYNGSQPIPEKVNLNMNMKVINQERSVLNYLTIWRKRVRVLILLHRNLKNEWRMFALVR